ncbi:hypothetical protein GCM10027361_28690 [Erwinia aphidicola]
MPGPVEACLDPTVIISPPDILLLPCFYPSTFPAKKIPYYPHKFLIPPAIAHLIRAALRL